METHMRLSYALCRNFILLYSLRRLLLSILLCITPQSPYPSHPIPILFYSLACIPHCIILYIPWTTVGNYYVYVTVLDTTYL